VQGFGIASAMSLEVLVKIQQYVFCEIAGLSGLSFQSEAVAEIPRVLIEIRSIPVKAFDRSVTEYEEVSFTISWHPAVRL
jgi:hypothetical protein